MNHSPFSILHSRRGQALFEAIVASSVLTVGFLGFLTLLARSLSVNRVIADNYIGTYLAAEGVEVVKNMIDTNTLQRRSWNTGFSNGNFEVQYDSQGLIPSTERFLSFDPDTNLYSYGGSLATSYKRTVSVALVSTEEIIVHSLVSWSSRGGGTFQVDVEDHFLNWRP